MVHPRQSLAFGREARHDFSRVHPELDELERHLPAYGLFLLGEIHGAHAALAEDLDDPVVVDAFRVGIAVGSVAIGGGPGHKWGRDLRVRERGAFFVVMLNQRDDLLPQCIIITAGAVEVCVARFALTLEGVLEDVA